MKASQRYSRLVRDGAGDIRWVARGWFLRRIDNAVAWWLGKQADAINRGYDDKHPEPTSHRRKP